MVNGETEQLRKEGAKLYTAYCLMPAPKWFFEEYETLKTTEYIFQEIEQVLRQLIEATKKCKKQFTDKPLELFC